MSNQARGGVVWATLPPTESSLPWLPVLSPRPNVTVRGIILSGNIVGVMTHFLDGRTHPCTGDQLLCEGCFRNAGPRWKGYLAILLPAPGRISLAELTVQAVRSNLILRDGKEDLRGSILTVQRVGKAANARCAATVERRKIDGPLPPEPDVRGALIRLWGVNQLDDSRAVPAGGDA